MSGRTIVSLEPRGLDGGASVKLEKAPVRVDNARVPLEFDLDPDGPLDWAEDSAVAKQGKKILDRLQNAHPAVQIALQDLLRAPRGEIRPIYFYIGVEDAERLYWETLCNDGGDFLALDERWPIARMADSEVDQDSPVHGFSPPLKIFAVLSALGLGHDPEWGALRDAAVTARGQGLAVELSVVSGNRDLVGTIQTEIADGLTGVSVAPLPNRSSKLESDLRAFKPNVVHFFCHGAVGDGVSLLELATANDFDDPPNASPMKLEFNDLVDMLPSNELWLVTLNCCEGSRGTANMHSMAHQLVAQTGLPAAVGMLEPFNAQDAHEFCGGFYGALFTKVRESMVPLADGDSATMEWADLLRIPRRNIAERNRDDPVNNREWALPVVYVRPEPFQLRKLGGAAAAVTPEMVLDAQLVAGMLRTLPPDAPEEARTVLLAMLDDIPPELRPDRFGNLGGDNVD